VPVESEPRYAPPSRELDQLDLTDHTGLEARRRAGGNVQAEADGIVAREQQRRIGLREMQVGTDLNRTVAGVLDHQRAPGSPGVEVDVPVGCADLAGDHVIG